MVDLDECRMILGIGPDLTFEQLVSVMMDSNGASHVKGTAAEWHLIKHVEKSNRKITKVSDTDKFQRFDYIIGFGSTFQTCECKIASKSGRASLDFRDKRDVRMPSGKTWRTHARNRMDQFDILAVNMVNVTGNVQDFRFIPQKYFPKYKPSKAESHFLYSDQFIMENDFYAHGVKITEENSMTLEEALIFNENQKLNLIQCTDETSQY